MTSSTNSYSMQQQRLHKSLSKMISATESGDRLPSEPKLARKLGVSRATLREAMRTFETQGLIQRRQGVGTFVVRPPHVIETGLEVLESIESLAKRIDLEISTGELTVKQRLATQDEAEVLQLGRDIQVISISRVIQAEGRPVAYFIDTLPESILSAGELSPVFRGSVLELLLQRGDPQLANSRCEISAVDASPEVARALHIQRGDALLRFVSCLFSIDGEVIDYSTSYFLPGYFRFHVVRKLERT